MADAINIRLPQALQDFVRSQTDGTGVYESTSEYVRDLIRRDFERVEAENWQRLEALLAPGLVAEEDSFKTVSKQALLDSARARRRGG